MGVKKGGANMTWLEDKIKEYKYDPYYNWLKFCGWLDRLWWVIKGKPSSNYDDLEDFFSKPPKYRYCFTCSEKIGDWDGKPIKAEYCQDCLYLMNRERN